MEQNTEVMEATMQTDTEGNAFAEKADTISTPTGEDIVSGKDNNAESALTKPFVVRYRHKNTELTREEAVSYAQKGMKYDSMAPMLDKISYLATIKGKNAHDLIDEYIKREEEMYRSEVIDKHGDNEEVINMFMEKYRAENKSKYEKAQIERKEAEEIAEKRELESLESRIANEFFELNKEFPEINNISSVPEEVLKEAEKGKNLTDAYLRYLHKENLKIEDAKQTAVKNSTASAGKVAGTGEADDPVMRAFLKGLQK